MDKARHYIRTTLLVIVMASTAGVLLANMIII